MNDIPRIDANAHGRDFVAGDVHGEFATLERAQHADEPLRPHVPQSWQQGLLRIPVKVISDSGLNVISDSGQSDHRSERSDAGVGL